MFPTLTLEEAQERAAKRRLRGLFYMADHVYHDPACPGVSSTKLKRVLVSPEHAQTPVETTEAMELGTAIHCALLEPERFARCVRVTPTWEHHHSSKIGKEERARWYSDLPPDAIEVSKEELLQIDGIFQACGRKKTWRGLVQDACFEIAAFALDKETGVLMKAKADIWNGPVIADLKSTADARPEKFVEKTVINYDYDLSASYYRHVFNQALRGEVVDSFVWIPVEKKKPHGVSFVLATHEMMRIGELKWRKALQIYADCDKQSVWPGLPDEVVEHELPAFYLRRYEP